MEMDRRTFVTAGLLLAAGSAVIGPQPAAAAQAPHKVVSLPKPELTGGAPLFACLAQRRTNRHISDKELPLDVMGALFWAAVGVNRESGKRTIPTAMNKQEIVVYAARGDGVWKYLPDDHSMSLVMEGDERGRFGTAGCVLLYCVPIVDRFNGMHAGSAYQNVGLYCAQAGLANVVKFQKHDALSKDLTMPQGWDICITQHVGYPAKMK